MAFRFRPGVCLALSLGLFLMISCSKKEQKDGAAADSTAADTTLSYVSEEVSFGLFFDENATKRTVRLGSDETQTVVYIVVHFPETMHISAVEYRIVLPEGVTIDSDKFYEKRAALLGTFETGISETFPCVPGPKLVLHALTLNIPRGLSNAELAIMTDPKGDFLGVVMCDETLTMVPAASYKAVINPTD